MRIKRKDVAIELGMTPVPGVRTQISSGYDYSYICIRDVEAKLAITPEVSLEYGRQYHNQSPLSNHKLMLGLMNIALHHHQYINFEEI